MEKDIKLIRKLIEDFMEKHNCLVEVETASYGWTTDGRIAYPKAKIIVKS